MRITNLQKLTLTVLGLASLGLLLLSPKTATAANPTTMNFQGKVVNADGTNVTNGTYSFIFRVYNTASPTTTSSCTSTASCLWEETQSSVTITNGVFQVELGSACSLTSASCNNSTGGPINWSSTSSLYLTMKFNGDAAGFMTPTIHITSVPFAFQADNSSTLGGLAAGNFVQLAQGLQTDGSTTNASIAINKTGSTANILTLQKSSANVLLLDNNGLLTLQPAASLTSGQTAFTQTLTNASSTGGTVQGYNQTITVNNTSSASTTNGFNVSLTDNTSLANTNTGIKVSLAGSNSSQIQYGIDSSVNGGVAIRGTASGGRGLVSCGTNIIGNYSVGVCGNGGVNTGVGVVGSSSSSTSTTNATTVVGTGVYGISENSGTATNFYNGIKGVALQTANAAYTSVGVYGNAQAGSAATTYGGYFKLDSGSSATLGAALYATNSTVAANILDLQDNTTSVFTVGDGGLITLQPAANLTGGQTEIAQSFTNADTTGGQTNGLRQTITVNTSTSAANTNGIKIALTDNGSLGNTNYGAIISLAGSNTNQLQYGVDSTVNHGIGIRGVSTGGGASTCGSQAITVALGICGSATGSGTGVLGVSSASSAGGISGAGVTGYNEAAGSVSGGYYGLRGIAGQSASAAYSSVGVYGNAQAGTGATAYGGSFSLVGSSATLGAALYATNSTVAANILDLQDNTTSVFTVGDGGLITLQPAANLTAGQTEVAQTLTNASSTGGTVNGYSQTITVNNTSSASTTNGISIAINDTAAALGNISTGIKISLGQSATNTGRIELGVDSNVTAGIGGRFFSSGSAGNNTSCGSRSGQLSIGVCGSSNGTNGTGVLGYSSGNGANALNSLDGAGVVGINDAGGTGVAAKYYAGVRGIASPTTAAAYTLQGVYGQAKGGAGATVYGGYFTLQGSSATLGSALYASNDTVAANILDLQDNTTSVFTVGDGGLITLQPAAALTGSSNQNNISQTLTNNQTGGNVDGYKQTITVSNSSGATNTNGFVISVTDSTSLSNQNTGIFIAMQGTNINQTQEGIDVSTNHGIGIKAATTGTGGSVACGDTGTNSIGICGSNTSANGDGIIGAASGTNNGGLSSASGYLTAGSGVSGYNYSSTTAGGSIIGLGGYSNGKGASGSYTSIGTFGVATAASSSAKIYGGYFSLDSGSSTTAGAALYATNSTVAANILDLQDNTTSVFTVGDGGLITATSNSASGLVVKNSSTSKTVLSVDTSGNKLVLGQAGASGVDGTMVFQNSVGSNTVGFALQANPVSSYTLLLPTTGPSTSQCLQTDSTTANQLKFAACSVGGSGYATIQDEGSNLTARSTINFIGNSVACVDNSGSSRTDCTVAPTLQNAYDNYSGIARITTSSASNNIILTSGSGFDSTGIFQVQNDISSNALSIDTTALNTLLVNSNFENATTTNWVYSGAAGGSASQSNSRAYLGSRSLAVTSGTTATANDGVKYVVGTSLSNSTTYTLSFYAIIPSGVMTTLGVTYTPDGGTTNFTCMSGKTVLTTAWQRYSCSFNSTQSAVNPNSSAFFIIKNGDTTTRTFYVDAVQLEQDVQANAYKETGINLQGAVTSNTIFSGLLTLQPAAGLDNGQSEVSQTFTASNSSVSGTINGYNQAIVVNNSTAGTTNGFNISLSDNTALTNTNKGISITLAGSNTSQAQYGVDINVNNGVGLRVVSSAGSANVTCAGTSLGANWSLGVCGDSTSTGGAGTGVYGRSSSVSAGISTSNGAAAAGVVGTNSANTTAGKFALGLDGYVSGVGTAGTSAGVYGEGKAGAGASTYGGYFALASTSSATLGAALYATNSTVAANILDLQDNTTSVFTVGDGGLITLQPAANLTAGQTEVAQTLTNASSTGGTVNGYSQTITVNNTSSASTTNGFNISLTDNTSLANNNTGLKILLGGTNANQNLVGVDASVNSGIAIRATSTSVGQTTTCAGVSLNTVAVCADASAGGAGVIGRSAGGGSGFGSNNGYGLYGFNSSGGSAGLFYTGTRGSSVQTANAAYTSTGVFGQGGSGTGATAYGGYFALNTSSTATLGSALYATNSTVAANILDLQDNTTSVFTVGDGGLITLQPAANLTAGQTEVAQTLTNASSTGGTVNGYSQTITVNNTSSASTTNGFNISLTDNTALANTNNGIKISLAGSNTNQKQYGVDVSANSGVGLRGASSGAGNVTCGGIQPGTGTWSIGVCGDSTASSSAGTGVFGRSQSTSTSSASGQSSAAAGVAGVNTANTTSGTFIVGAEGYVTGNGTTGTSSGVYGEGKAGSGATTYGGYFALATSSAATLGAALYATNSTVAANILDLQDNTTSVFTVADGGLITLQPAANLTAGQTEVAQTFTNGDTTGGTVNGYNQSITVNNASGTTTTNGFNISLTDNTALSNANRGINISLAGTNTSQDQVGVNSNVNAGTAIKGTATGPSAFAGCTSTTTGVCGIANYANDTTGGVGVYGTSNGGSSNINGSAGSGVIGTNTAAGAVGDFYAGIKGLSTQTASAAYTSTAVYGKGKAGTGATAYGGYFTLDSGSSATNGAGLYVSNSTIAANILQLQDNTTSVFTVGDGGLITLQPAANLTAGQTEVAQTLTNASSTGGTVNGYSQTITVNNTSSASTTNGFNISLTDNTSLANTNNGIKISLAGSNISQIQTGIDVSVNNGTGIKVSSSGSGNLTCGTSSTSTWSIGGCFTSTKTTQNTSTGIYGEAYGPSSTLLQPQGVGVFGEGSSSTTAGQFNTGVKGSAFNSSTAGTSVGVYGRADSGTGASIYGGYFTLGTSGATAGAALYASNSTVAGNILDLQDNTTSVFTVGDGGLITLQPAANLTAGQTEVAQTLTNASSTGGTVNGYSQTITVSNTSSLSTTNGLNITINDNASSLVNTNRGLKVSLGGSNTQQVQIGVDSLVALGIAIRGVSTGGDANANASCAGTGTTAWALGVCGDSQGTTLSTGVYGRSSAVSTGLSSATGYGDEGVFGINTANTASGKFAVGVKGLTSGTGTAGTAIGVYGQGNQGAGATAYGGYFALGTGGATAGSALYATNSTVAANILDLQDNTTSVFTVGDGGLITLQPAANLTAGQTEVAQTLTNASSTGGTVNGYSQTITVNNTSSASTTNGFNISLADNASSLANTNVGISISLSGTNSSQKQIGVDTTVTHGIAIRAISNSGPFTALTCADINGTNSIAVCGDSLDTGTAGIGVYGRSSGGATGIGSKLGSGVSGTSSSTGVVGNFYKGVTGIASQSAAAAYTSVGIYGQSNGGAGATQYGGYFTLGTGGATAGAGLYATNSTVAANILDLQDNTTSVFTVGDGGLITATSNSSSGLVVKNSSTSKTVLSVDTSGNKLVLGQAGASGVDGTLVFQNSVGSNTVGFALQADPVSSYTLLLPTTGPAVSQCLQTDSTTANQLKFAACSAGSGTALSINGGSVGATANFVDTAATSTVAGIAYTNTTGTITTALGNADNTHAGALTASTQAIGGDKTFSGNTTLTGTVLAKNASDSATAFQIQNAAGSNALSVDTTAINTLLANSNFENATTTNWVYSGAGGGSAARSTSQQYLGAASLAVTSGTTATANDGVKYVVGTSLSNSTNYTLSFYAKLNSVVMTHLGVTYTPDGGTTNFACMSNQTVITTAWQNYSCTFNSTQSAVNPNASAFFIITNGDTTTRTFYIDAVQLEQASQANAYKETGLNLQGTVTSNTIFSGLLTLQPASSLVAGQSEVQQTFTNGSSTGGTVNGYNQTITVNNTSSATTTNGINISLSDNSAGGIVNNNTGLKITLAGSNASQKEIGLDVSVTNSVAIRAVNSGGGTNVSCAGASNIQAAICADATGSAAFGIYARSQGGTAANLTSASGSGIFAFNDRAGTAGDTYAGVKGVASQTAGAAYTSAGVYGNATGGAGATTYGGYFTLQGSSATSGASLFATNSTVAANILELQDGTGTPADVMTVGDGGVTTFTPQVASASAFLVKNSSGNKILAIDNSASTAHLKVYDSSATQAYADIYYDDGTSTAVFAASSGTTSLGSGSGPISIAAGTGGAVTITADAASGFTTTTGALTLTGAAASTWSTSAGLLTIQGGGGLSLLAASSNTVTVDSGTTGSVVLGATNTTSAKAVSAGNANSGSTLILEGGTGGSAIQIGNGATAHGVKIATDPTTVQTVTIGSTNTSSATTIQGGTNDITLNSGDGILLKSTTTSAVALNVASSSGSSVFNIDTTKANANNKVSNASFESALSGWSALNAGAASQSSAQAYEGVDSMLIATGTNASGGGASYNTGGAGFLVNGTTYTLSAYVKTDSNLPVTTFEMGHADNGTAPTLVSCLTAQSLPLNGGWQRFTCTWTSGAITGSPFIYFKQTDTVNRNLYIDDVLLQTDANSDTNYRNAAINFTGAIVNGSVVLQNAVNSTNALQVENASGNAIFNVDTTDSNLISNPGLETNATGWSAIGTSTTIVRDSSNSYLGGYSLKVTTGTAADSGAQFTLNPTVTAISTNYTVSFFARRASGDATAFTDLIARYSADGTTTAGHFSDCSVTAMNSQTVLNTGWTRYFCTVNTTTTAVTTSAYVLIKDTAGAAHTWYIDGVQLEAASTASAYGAGAVSLNGVITSPVVFKGLSNSTTAFQIQNSSSLNLLGVDSINNAIQIGSSTTDANAIFLVLDSYNTAADPTAPANGAMYYNTSTNVFRCRENGVWKNCIDPPSNASTADQSPTAATLTYLTGSSITIPQGGVRVGSQFIWRMSLTKTAAGTLAPTFAVVFGTNGTTGDTARASFTLPVETAAVDTAQITIICTVRSVSGTGTISCNLSLVHNDANATGFVGTATSGSIVLTTTSGTFDDTIANSIIGVTLNSNTAEAFTFQQVQAQSVNL